MRPLAAREIRSPLARLAWLLLAILWAVAGWWIVLAGELALSPDKRSAYPVTIDGASALFMASIFFVLSAVSAGVLLQSLRAARAWWLLPLGVDLLLPLAWLLV